MNTFLLIAHLIGIVIGVGGATIGDLIVLHSISDNRFDLSEFRIFKLISSIVIVGLLLLVGSGVGLILTGAPTSPRFWAKMTVIGVLCINGILLHTVIFPKIKQCVYEEWAIFSDKTMKNAPLFLAIGVTSTFCWYVALILGAWRTLTVSYGEIIGICGLLWLGIVFTSVVFGYLVQRHYQPSKAKNVIRPNHALHITDTQTAPIAQTTTRSLGYRMKYAEFNEDGKIEYKQPEPLLRR